MRLYDAISKYHVRSLPTSLTLPPQVIVKQAENLHRLELDLRSAVCIDVSNVAEYLYSGTDKEEWEWSKDFPNLAPPFENMWIEYDMPTLINSEAYGVSHRADGNMQIGLFWQSHILPNKDWGSHIAMFAQNWQTRQQPFMIAEGIIRVDRAGQLVTDEKVLAASSMTSGPSLTHHNPLLMGVDRVFDPETGKGYFGGFDMMTLMFAPALAISFMHCKNVEIVDAPPVGSRQERRWLERQGVDFAKFKTLTIDPMKKVLRTEGQSEKVGIQKALHICRGHFATYSEEHPLFGKYAGTFWKPSHVRGSADVGSVFKDYRVKGGKAA